MSFRSVNPTTESLIAEYPAHSDAQVDAALERAATAFRAWSGEGFEARARVMVAAAELLEGELPVVGELLTSEMGKTFAAAKGEAAKCALALRYYAEHAARIMAPEPIATRASRSGVRFDPLGPVFAVMPWNFPLWQVIRFAAPGLMAGNVAVLKHASNVPGSAKYLEELFARAGAPAGVFTTLYVDHAQADAIIADPRVRGVTLTGSEGAGRAIGAAAGRALKPCVLELGGSDPFIVGAHADRDLTVPNAVTARVQNNGQSCIASKRFLVLSDVADEFVARFAAAMGDVVRGDPMDPATALGPLATASQRDQLAEQVAKSVAAGATVLAGGEAPEGVGYFYPATVLSDVPADSPAGCEELFGPVAVVRVVDDLDQAIAVANDSPWGLGASIWSSDAAEVDAVIERAEAGMVFANSIVASTPELPFGGVKDSGFGRELSRYGMHEFTNIKTYYVA
ncbi:MAG TPA: NAD-dependent succinate-semialdehyde dehydrogenase [Acidimicrobiales bacterium]|nr:NAD-dependent succinate-semialdehyde dehydrogenase [Acidimicrobiales bacterium]